MQKPEVKEYNPYFKNYIDLVQEGYFLSLLSNNTNETISFFENIALDKQDYRYAKGKWTIKEILMHIIDTERVMAYRALVASRGDNKTPLPSVDEDLYAANVDVSKRTMADLLLEFKAVRSATEILFKNITEEQSNFLANAVTYQITARAIGYIMIGHILHHLNIVRERYL
jgi:hypothetical protein